MNSPAKVNDVYEFRHEGEDSRFDCTLVVVRVLGEGPDDLVFFDDGSHSKQKHLVEVSKHEARI